MADSKLQINFWNYNDAANQSAEDVKRWKEMGMTMVMTGGVDYTAPERAAGVASVLEECERQGMTAIVFEDQFDIRTYMRQSREEFEAKALAALRFYEQFPAAKYVFVWDEPGNDEQWNAMGEVCAFVRNNSKQIRGFCSLNHYCGQPRATLYARLDRYLETCRPDILLYNCYSQCFEKEEEKEQGLENYFTNLKLFHDYAEKHGLTLATSLTCVGHWQTRTPTQEDIRWQLSTAIAHGVNQIYWFHPLEFLTDPADRWQFRQYPVNYKGEPTATYEPFCYENNRLLAEAKKYGLLEGAKLEKVTHVFRSYGGCDYFYKDEHDYVYEIRNVCNKPLILSQFVRADGKHVLMIVNNAQRGHAEVVVVFKKELGLPDRMEYIGAGSAIYVVVD